MTTAAIIIAYIIHIILCRMAYIAIIKLDKSYYSSVAWVLWFTPFVGLGLNLIILMCLACDKYNHKESWFNPTPKNNEKE